MILKAFLECRVLKFSILFLGRTRLFICFLFSATLILLVSKPVHNCNSVKPGSDVREEQSSTSFKSAQPNLLPLQRLFITEYVISEMKKVPPRGLEYCPSFTFTRL